MRSEPDYLKEDIHFKLGFLRNPKRFNVAVTRAKSLLVVVGNPKLLHLDPNWRQLIRYAQNKGGYTGIPFKPEDPVTELDLRKLEDRFRNLGLSQPDETSASAATTATLRTTTSQRGSVFSSFENLTISESPTSDGFDKLDDLPDLHEDAAPSGGGGGHFDQ